MILTCPNCDTQYVVKDGAIPPGGRQVRCAACKHSWHQDPEETASAEDIGTSEQEPEAFAPTSEEIAPEEQPVAEEQVSEEREDEDESFVEATLIEPRSGPEAEERAFEAAQAEAPPADEPQSETSTYAAAPFDMRKAEESDWSEPAHGEAQDDEFSPFAATPEPQRKGRNTLLATLIIVLVVVAAAAAFWFLAPADLKAKLGIGAAGATPLALVTTHMDRQRLASGNETLTINGRVINPTGKEQSVPPLQAQLKTKAGEVVYSWTIAPPARSLPAGASASFYSTEVDVPAGGDELTITLGTKES
ncbi:MAG TPA: zinc-ribbon domain-containing protein [Sphingomicrobium sp.]|jgi:predicted Zn finger-like uncharacterized protein